MMLSAYSTCDLAGSCVPGFQPASAEQPLAALLSMAPCMCSNFETLSSDLPISASSKGSKLTFHLPLKGSDHLPGCDAADLGAPAHDSLRWAEGRQHAACIDTVTRHAQQSPCNLVHRARLCSACKA